MNEHPGFDEFLTRQLKGNQSYLPDDGFTSRVMAGIPQPRRSPVRRQALLIGAVAVIIGALVLGQMPLMETASQIWQWSLNPDLVTLLKAGAGISAAMLIAGFVWLARDMELV